MTDGDPGDVVSRDRSLCCQCRREPMRGRTVIVVTAVLAASLGLQAQRPAADWTQWRGPNRDGVAPFSVPSAWPERLTQKWKLEVGTGYATPLVVGNRVYEFARQ